MEQWKPASGYERDYYVSNLGRVRSHRRGSTKILKPILEKWNGYYVVSLFDNCGVSHKVKVHRLVAEAFIPNSNRHPTINHKDEDKTNNCVSNLEWCTKAYNTAYGTARQRVRATYQRNCATKKWVL